MLNFMPNTKDSQLELRSFEFSEISFRRQLHKLFVIYLFIFQFYS